MDSSILLDKSYNDDRFALASIQGKRLITFGELKPDARLNRSMVVRLSSSALIATAVKHQKDITFSPTHTALIETNHLPPIQSDDLAVWDRLFIVPFRARIRGTKECDYEFAERVCKEAGGAVLAWAVEGAVRYIANKYRIEKPACVNEIMDGYRQKGSQLLEFLNERCVREENARIMSSAFLEAFRNYVGPGAAYTPAGIRREMEYQGFVYKRSNKGEQIIGLRLS